MATNKNFGGSSRYNQGEFKPKNPLKYRGTYPIIYRSSWELLLMKFLDENPSIIEWGSESIVVPYISPLDGREHRYFLDFVAKIITKSSNVKVIAIEVKPFAQTKPPVQPKRQTKSYVDAVKTYEVNKAKWAFATEYCKRRKVDFVIFTEYDLGLKKRKEPAGG